MKKYFSSWMCLTLLPISCLADTTPDTNPTATPDTIKAPAPKTMPSTEASPDINCQYKLPSDTSTLTQPLLSTWAENAAIQSFQFNAESIQAELNALKACYTEQGWKGFNEALETSGNLEAIKKNKLSVTSRVNGTATIQNMKETQWKASVPLKVVYQNKDKKLQQTLNVELLVAFNKKAGTLGIMQVIAVPEKDGASSKK